VVARGIGSSQQANHRNAGTGLQDLALVCQAHAVPVPNARAEPSGEQLRGVLDFAVELVVLGAALTGPEARLSVWWSRGGEPFGDPFGDHDDGQVWRRTR
jgi:hypothetical protein